MSSPGYWCSVTVRRWVRYLLIIWNLFPSVLTHQLNLQHSMIKNKSKFYFSEHLPHRGALQNLSRNLQTQAAPISINAAPANYPRSSCDCELKWFSNKRRPKRILHGRDKGFLCPEIFGEVRMQCTRTNRRSMVFGPISSCFWLLSLKENELAFYCAILGTYPYPGSFASLTYGICVCVCVFVGEV